MAKVSSIPGEEEKQPNRRKGSAATAMPIFKKDQKKLLPSLILLSKKYLAALSILLW